MPEHPITTDSVRAWEDAYLRFETPDQEIAKFTSRLHALGAQRWRKDARILDLFCGRGNGLVALERLGFSDLLGVDLSPRLAGLHTGRARMIAADCRALPISTASQDIAIVQGGLHHLTDVRRDLPAVIAEVQRVLKPGGRFVVVEPWLTPFLRLAHAVSAGPARKLWGRLDALATMIEYEGEVYLRWLESPDFILTALTGAFTPERTEQRWGKLQFVGRMQGSE
jgi:ubiquinone/menaquinone biosynthesis C-methylase UbiE